MVALLQLVLHILLEFAKDSLLDFIVVLRGLERVRRSDITHDSVACLGKVVQDLSFAQLFKVMNSLPELV